MMKRKLLGIAVAVGALAVIVSALALKSATVTNNLSLSITNTTASLIAITGGTDADAAFDSSSGHAVITLPATGFQPGSSYTFYTVFNVVNNSSASKVITLSASGTPANVTMTFVDVSNVAIATPTVIAGGSLPVGIKVDLTNNAALNASVPLTVSVSAN